MNITDILKKTTMIAAAVMVLCACEEETLTIGDTVTRQTDLFDIESQSYGVATSTVRAADVLSYTSNSYFGSVTDPLVGATVTSEFSSQLALPALYKISDESHIMSRYNGMAAADSCNIVLYLDSPFVPADSLVAMKMKVWKLDDPLTDGKKYYTDYDPLTQNITAGSTNQLTSSKMFTYMDLTESDSIKALSTYTPSILIQLDQPYGEYNNFGTYLMQQYYRHPEYFQNNYAFVHHVCPGFFFQITDGSGFYSRISDISLNYFYQVYDEAEDTTYTAVKTFVGTKEVLQTTKITNDDARLDEVIAAAGDTTYLKSPAGLLTEAVLPVNDIKHGHEKDSLVAASIVFERYNNITTDKRCFEAPASVLMIPADSIGGFFLKNKLPDSQTSYYTTFASTTNTYSFTNISNLITTLWNKKQQGMADEGLTEAEWESAHPQWNKVLIVPISVTTTTTETSTSITKIEQSMSLSSTRLVRGTAASDSPLTIDVVYSKFK